MKIYKHSGRNIFINGIVGWIIMIYFSVMLLFLLVWFFPGNDKWNYKSYKKYEQKIDMNLQNVVDRIKTYNTKYSENSISKKQIILYLEEASEDLNKLYDSFTWKRGDEITKELFLIKKQIIIDYAQLYEQKSKALQNELIYNDAQETDYISTLLLRYSIKDRLQREKFDLLDYK